MYCTPVKYTVWPQVETALGQCVLNTCNWNCPIEHQKDGWQMNMHIPYSYECTHVIFTIQYYMSTFKWVWYVRIHLSSMFLMFYRALFIRKKTLIHKQLHVDATNHSESLVINFRGIFLFQVTSWAWIFSKCMRYFSLV